MGTVKKVMFIPGKVENWVFVLETNKIGVFGLPLKTLGIVIDCMSVNFCGCLDKMYILNPSSGLDFTWGAI
jgi:CRAL/TRIO domain